MTEYSIANEIVSVSTAVENEQYLRRNVMPYINDIDNVFKKWYSEQYDCNDLLNHADQLVAITIYPIIECGIDMLREQGVYSIDKNVFHSQYLNECLGEYYEILETIEDRLDEIDEQLQEEKDYRKARKAYRGKSYGIGFGFADTIKEKTKAGMINATTGMLHSVRNIAGNTVSSLSASSDKNSIFKKSKGILLACIKEYANCAKNAIRTSLETEANIKCKFVTETERAKCNAIIDSYNNNRIPAEILKKQLLEALILDPYNDRVYVIIWNEYGDKSHDLRKMSSFFEGNLEAKIKKMAEDYGEKTFEERCSEYIEAYNKISKGIEIEDIVIDTLKSLREYCEQHSIEEELIPQIQICKDILKRVDVELKSYKGKVYDTREEAESVKNDYAVFYDEIKEIEIESKTPTEIDTKLKFQSKEFNTNFDSIFELECKLRNPEKLYENVRDIMALYFDEELMNDGFDIPSQLGEFDNRKNVIYNIVQILSDEVPILNIVRAKKGKSGLMVTNYFFRVYSKGLFSTQDDLYDIEMVKDFKFLSKNQYQFTYNDRVILFELKKKISLDQQNSFVHFLNHLIQFIGNLNNYKKRYLYHFLYGQKNCICGIKLLDNEKICPKCKRILMDNGKFVETKLCSSCKYYIPLHSKFCTNCGQQLDYEEEQQIEENKNVEKKDAISEVAEVQTDENKKQPEEFLNCKKCGHKIILGKKFCSQCGTSVDVDTPKKDYITCKKCGNAIKVGKKFCSHCGERIEDMEDLINE